MAEHKIENPRYVNMTTTFSDAEAKRLNAWIERQDPKPSRSAAIRAFVLAALQAAKTE